MLRRSLCRDGLGKDRDRARFAGRIRRGCRFSIGIHVNEMADTSVSVLRGPDAFGKLFGDFRVIAFDAENSHCVEDQCPFERVMPERAGVFSLPCGPIGSVNLVDHHAVLGIPPDNRVFCRREDGADAGLGLFWLACPEFFQRALDRMFGE